MGRLHMTRRISATFAILAGALCCLSATSGSAQIPSGILGGTEIQTLQQQLLNQQLLNQQQLNIQPVQPSIQTYQPVPLTERAVPPPSRLETLYSERAGRPLSQFGYEQLGVPIPITVAQVGAVQDGYVLGPGDEVVVVLRGQENATYRQRVNRDGQIILPRLNPIQAAGRTFGDFRAELEAQVQQAFITTDVFMTIGEIRQVSVLVTGEVRSPGMLTGTH